MNGTESPMGGYRHLIAWKKGLDLVDSVYDAAVRLPPEEKFELSSQMRRAVVSIPSNVAEGYCRKPRARANHYEIAIGSAGELDTLVEVCTRRKFFSPRLAEFLLERIVEERKILQGLIASVEARFGIGHESHP